MLLLWRQHRFPFKVYVAAVVEGVAEVIQIGQLLVCDEAHEKGGGELDLHRHTLNRRAEVESTAYVRATAHAGGVQLYRDVFGSSIGSYAVVPDVSYRYSTLVPELQNRVRGSDQI